MNIFRALQLVAVAALPWTSADAQELETALFDGYGNAVAYIVADDELTIYLWTGAPVAYLVADDDAGFHIYGFNGRHLGWLVEGLVRDRRGAVACAFKERLQNPKLEPLKYLKQLKPLKGLKYLPPLRPMPSSAWGESCQLLLASGRS